MRERQTRRRPKRERPERQRPEPPSDSHGNVADELGLNAGAVVKSTHAKYVIERVLDEGVLGAVFRVHDSDNPDKKYAMKVEKRIETRPLCKLKMEITILICARQLRGAEHSHFTSLIDRGKNEKFYFVVKQLLGQSLHELKELRPGRVFSLGTGIAVAIQCLEACQGLHAIDFIHRDLKPSNYAIGLGDMQRVVYIFGFGIARKITQGEGNTLKLKPPRCVVAFKGTVRYASLSCHRNTEMSFKDDCESWFYLLLDLIRGGGLPWAQCRDKDEVQHMKEDGRENHGQSLFGRLKGKNELWSVLDYIDHLTYFDRVDYNYIYAQLKLAAKTCDVDLESPYDWEDTHAKKPE